MVESVVKISVDEVSVIVDGCDDESTEDVSVDIIVVSNEEDATSVEVVHSGVEISVDKISVSVVEGGSVDEIEEVRSVEVLKKDVSVNVSVVKSVEIEDVSDREIVSVVEPTVEISVEKSVEVLDDSVSETEVDENSVIVLSGGSEEE